MVSQQSFIKLATADVAFIGREGIDMFKLSDIGPGVDLALSFITIVSTEAWEVFM